MTLRELKEEILDNTLDDSFIIFKYNKDSFLVNQYVEEIAQRKMLQVENITSLDNTYNSSLSLVLDFSNTLNILRVDEFNELIENYEDCKNCIVICNKVSKDIEYLVKNYIIDFPELKDWQVKEYLKNQCSGLDTQDIDLLYKLTNNDIYRSLNELDKIKDFNKKEQKEILADLIYGENSDLYNSDIFELTSAVLKSDIAYLLNFLLHRDFVDVDPFALTNLLLKDLKKILFIKFNSGVLPSTIGVSDKQAWYIKNNYRNCSEKFLNNSIYFLSGLDNKIKNGELEISKDYLNDYIICHLLNFY